MRLSLQFFLILPFFSRALGEMGCIKCPDRDQTLPHPTDCHSYVECEGGVATFHTCSHGQVFNSPSLTCIASSTHTQCKEESGPINLKSCPESITISKNPRESGSLSSDGSCAKQCPDYERLVIYPEVHSVCAAEESLCWDSHLNRGVRIEDEWILIAGHNTRRQRVAIGQESGSALSHNLPSAANMNALVWNGELAKVAQALADTCSEYGDCENCRRITSRPYKVEQNPYWVWTTSADRPDWDGIIEEWYSEVQYVSDESWLFNYTNPDGVVLKHFTQVIWAVTEEMGCGWTAVDKGSWVSHIFICNYGPGGNVKGEPVYEEGSPASNCPHGISPTLPGLCDYGGDPDPCVA